MLVVVVVVVVVGYLVQCSSGQRQAREAPITLERKITPACLLYTSDAADE